MNKIHKVLLEIMKEIDKIFTEHNIPYSIGCGTALGQFRNKKIIEWDDDIDLIVDYDVFDLLPTLLRKHLPKRYYVQFKDIDKKHHMSLIKVFDLEEEFNVPEDEFRNKKLKNKLSIDIFRIIRTSKKRRPRLFGFWTMWLYIRNMDNYKIIKFLKFPFYILSTRFLEKRRNSIIKKVYDKNGKRFFMDEGINKFTYPFLDINKTKRVSLNNIKVNVFEEQEKYLRNHYGENFMTPKKYSHKIQE